MEYMNKSAVLRAPSGKRSEEEGQITPPHSMSYGAMDENRRCKHQYIKELRQSIHSSNALSYGAVDTGQMSAGSGGCRRPPRPLSEMAGRGHFARIRREKATETLPANPLFLMAGRGEGVRVPIQFGGILTPPGCQFDLAAA